MVGISRSKSRREGLCSGDKKSAQAVNPCSRSDAESAQYRNKFRGCKEFFPSDFPRKRDCARTSLMRTASDIFAMFELLKTDAQTSARRGRLITVHGIIDTPAFLPVGTQGSVKAISPRE